MKKGLQRLSDNSGLSLVEIMISCLVGSLIVFLMSSLFDLMANFSKQINAQIVRDDVQRMIIMAIKSPRALAHTCSQNAAFANCFVQGGTSCASESVQPLNLYDTSGLRISGTAADPVYLSEGGASCNPTANNCAFRMETSFRPQGFPQDCGSTCDDLLPRDQPRSGRLHELMTVQYSIFAIQQTGKGVNLSDSEGSVTFALDRLYLSGCPTL